MENSNTSAELLSVLNAALARELKVSVLYMLQHAIWNGKTTLSKDKLRLDKPKKFVASHWPTYLPGMSLKKIAITEMRHAEQISERIIILGGEIIKLVPPYKVGDTPKDILELDKKLEASAIKLYKRIIDMSAKEGDNTTEKLFKRILSDEEGHYDTFSKYLKNV